jgi:Secretion system C-terminal sorting domain
MKLTAQTYSSVGLSPNGFEYDTLVNYGDSLHFTFSSIQAGAVGNAKVRVYYAGDFGDNGEYMDVLLPDLSFANAQVGPNQFGDCTSDMDSVYFDATLINSWLPSFTITLIPSGQVDYFCGEQRVRVELIYDYCAFGIPTYADFTIPDDITCATSPTQTLVGTPAGGTYVGSGMSGNIFNPAGLMPGNYSITYTATDGIGCTTSSTKSIKIGNAPTPINELVCEGTVQSVNLSSKHVFSNDLQFTSTLDTANSYTFPAITSSPTTYYYANYIQPAYYMIDTIIALDSMIVDHDMLSGDDRGGILISDTNVYILGDNGVARFNLDLQNGTFLAIDNDAMFNDLTTKKIYSFSNAANDFPSNNMGSSFNATKIIELDVNLVPTGNEVILSETVTIGYGNSNVALMMSGFSEMAFSDVNNVFHKMNILTGEITNMGTHNMVSPYGSENWMDWGILGFDGTDYHAFYKDDNYPGNIVSYNFGNSTITAIDAVNDWSDLASFTVDQETNRLYFHYENSTFTFGGTYETLGYTTMSDSLNFIPGIISCPSEIEYTFNVADLGPDTTVCESIGAYVLEAGFGYESYTWNGVNNNWNVFPVTSTGQIIVDAVDAANCHLIDTVIVTFDPCLGISENENFTVSLYPNPSKNTFTVDAGVNEINSLEIVDMNGKVISSIEGKNTTTLTVDHQLQNGVYLVRIVSGTSTKIQRIVVQ